MATTIRISGKRKEKDLLNILSMISGWPGELVNPIFESEDSYADDFEKFGIRASTSGIHAAEQLADEVSILRFVNEVCLY